MNAVPPRPHPAIAGSLAIINEKNASAANALTKFEMDFDCMNFPFFNHCLNGIRIAALPQR